VTGTGTIRGATAALPVTCKFPGCDNPPAPAGDGPGRKPGFCTDPDHNATNAWRERQRLDAAARGENPPDADTPAGQTPVTMARISTSELLHQVKAEGGKLAATFERLLREAGTLADPEAVSTELAHVRTQADRRAAVAEEERAAADARALAAETLRTAADQAAESMAAQLAEMTEQLADANARAAEARDQLAAARTEHAAGLEQARADAQARVTAAEEAAAASVQRAQDDRDQAVTAAEHRADTAIERARADANTRVSAAEETAAATVTRAEADRDQARGQAATHQEAASRADQRAVDEAHDTVRIGGPRGTHGLIEQGGPQED
jgi:colicin import membrane protein